MLRTLRGAHRAGDLLEAELARTACRNKGAFCRDHPVSRKRQAYPRGKSGPLRSQRRSAGLEDRLGAPYSFVGVLRWTGTGSHLGGESIFVAGG